MIRINRAWPAEALVVLHVLLALVNSLVMTSVPRRLLVGVGVVLLAYEALGFRSHKYEQWFLYLLALWIALALTLNGVIFGEWVQESVYLPGNIGVALALCRGHVGTRTTGTLFYATATYFLYRLATVSSPAAIHKILVTGSANGISGFTLVLCGLHYAAGRTKGIRIGIAPAVLCLLVSALTLGRSGMAAGAFLLTGVAIYDLVQEHRRWLLGLKLVLYGGVVVATLVFVLPRLDAISFVFERFSEFGLGSEDRSRIWGSYGATLDGPGVVTGHGREELFGGYTNVHNSYILWHKSMGVLAIPLYLLSLLALVRVLTRDWILFVVLAAVLFRAFFDELLLPFRLFDFLYYFLVTTILVSPDRAPARDGYRISQPVEE